MISVTKITRIQAREILDSRGNPTIEVDVELSGGAVGRAAVPSGASTGEHEAWELRDGDKTRFGGKGVLKAVENVNTKIARNCSGIDALDQVGIDRTMIELDGTPNKGSSAPTRSSASRWPPRMRRPRRLGVAALQVPRRPERESAARPDDERPQRRRAFRRADRFPGIHDRAEGRVHVSARPSATARKSSTRSKGCCTTRNSAPRSATKAASLPNSRPTNTRSKSSSTAVKKAGYEFGQGHLHRARSGHQRILRQGSQEVRLQEIRRQERSCREDDRRSTRTLQRSTRSSPSRTASPKTTGTAGRNSPTQWARRSQLVGDDLFVTNVEFLKKGIDTGVANSILVKVNQIGSLTETFDAIELAKRNGYTAVLSHRSGETEDTTIADIAVATNAGQIKTGSLCRTDRVAKYNQLLRIEEILGNNAVYGGKL